MINRFKAIFFSFAFLVTLTNCSVSNNAFSDASAWIPQDFDPKKTTLLIEKYPGSEKINREMEKHLSENYPYKYVIADYETITSKKGKYDDLKKYPFAFVWRGERMQLKRSVYNSDPDGNFYDRISGKNYPTTSKYNNYGHYSFIPFINSIVKHFQ